MKLGMAGLPLSGKKTLFKALTGARGEAGLSPARHAESNLASVTVHDPRVDHLARVYKPKKTTYAKVEYLLPPEPVRSASDKGESGVWNALRTCDGLLHVIRNFPSAGGAPPSPERDFRDLEEEMILVDLGVVEKRLERLALDRRRGKKPGSEEQALLEACRDRLTEGLPLRNDKTLAGHPALRGFTFLSAKPVLVIFNNEDEDEAAPAWSDPPEGVDALVVRARLEMDIAAMDPDEAEEFLEAYNIRESALDRVIRSSFRMLRRISFFTVGSDEVRAWPVTEGTSAVEAAGTVHSDMAKGFIRAEVLPYEVFRELGSFQEAKKAGRLRLEGKEYVVKDGDIMHVRFNV
ncbi:MAG: redox-regulated ATPase YchF [Deltaproteobacteria bacterium]|nr:MAG: redox-regulated ATPase YchF [Deltaproteobacteria bacterium]